jgi:hypothetical protein
VSFYEDLWNSWVLRFSWARGVFAAVTLFALVPQFTDLSRFQALSAFHALVLLWDDATRVMGIVIGQLPFIPTIPSRIVSAFIFAIAVATPSLLSIAIPHKNPLIRRMVWMRRTMVICVLSTSFLTYIVMSHPDATLGVQIVFGSGVFIVAMLSVYLSYYASRAYVHGMIFAIGFVATAELLYLVKLPVFTDAVNRFTCLQLGLEEVACDGRFEE